MSRHDLGWCHQCETLQRLEDAPVLWVSYLEEELPCCVVCREGEPWGYGVWNAAGWVPEYFCMPCLIRACAERWAGYPGDDLRCDHAAGEIVWDAVVVHRKGQGLGHSRAGGHAERGRVDRVESVPLRLLGIDDYERGIVRSEYEDDFVPLCQICFRNRAQHAVRWSGAQGE
jgi:hypothetical protein